MLKKAAIWGAALVAIGLAAFLFVRRITSERRIPVQGVVLIADADPRKQTPIASVQIWATVGEATIQTKTDGSGFFQLSLPGAPWRREAANIRFEHPGYEPLQMTQSATNQIDVIRMTALARNTVPEPSGNQQLIKDVRVRYAAKATTPIEVGSTAKTFEVVNRGDVPCDGKSPCSPDGKWKAVIGGLTMDAGEGHEFRNTRASCIAGPCPFARIESDDYLRGGRTIKVLARNWSDTVTFFVEAEVIQTIPSDQIRTAYPIIFGRQMSFTLPPAGEGPSIEADVNGSEIIFPLGPALNLSWASCDFHVNADRTRLYRCELKPGYRFE